MRITGDYPISYDKTLAQAKKEAEIGLAIGTVDEIEHRWMKLIACDDYSLRDLKKETLLMDIEDLLGCCISFINKIAELDALMHHRKPSGKVREVKRFPFKEEI